MLNLEKSKEEWKILLGLSYYSNTLFQSIKLDTVICKLLVRNYASKIQTKMTISTLTQKIMIVKNLVRYEFIERLENPSYDTYLALVMERLSILQSFKELTVDSDT